MRYFSEYERVTTIEASARHIHYYMSHPNPSVGEKAFCGVIVGIGLPLIVLVTGLKSLYELASGRYKSEDDTYKFITRQSDPQALDRSIRRFSHTSLNKFSIGELEVASILVGATCWAEFFTFFSGMPVTTAVDLCVFMGISQAVILSIAVLAYSDLNSKTL